MENQIIVTPDTAAIIKVLDNLKVAEDSFLNLLTEMYGEEQGTNHFFKVSDKWEAVTDCIMKYLAVEMTNHLGRERRPDEPITI